VTTNERGLVVELDSIPSGGATVTVTGEGGATTEAELNGTETVLGFSQFRSMKVQNATVTVRIDGENYTESVDLRLLRLRPGGPLEFEGSSLQIPVSADSIGFSDGDVARIRLVAVERDVGTNVTATYDGGEGELVVGYDEYSVLLGDSGGVAVEEIGETNAPTVAGSGRVVGNLLEVAAKNTTVERTSDGLVVRNPLVRPQEEYAVTVDAGYGNWSNTVTARRGETVRGELVVRSAAVANAEVVFFTVKGDSVTVLKEYEYQPSKSIHDATVNSSGQATGLKLTVDYLEGGAWEGDVEVWVRNETDGSIGRVSVSAENVSSGAGGLTLELTGKHLTALNASGISLSSGDRYRILVVAGGETVPAELNGPSDRDGNEGDQGNNGGNGSSADSGRLAPLANTSPLVLAGAGLAGVALVAAGVLAFVVVRRRRGGSTGGRGPGGSGGTGGGARSGSRGQGTGAGARTNAGSGTAAAGAGGTTTLTVRVTDAGGRPVEERLRCEVRPTNATDGAPSEAFDDGTVTLQVPMRRCTVAITHDGTEVASRSVEPRGTDTVTFRLEPHRVTVTVRDEETGEPLVGARLVAELADDSRRSARADGRGRAQVRVPRLAGEVTFHVRADGYSTKRRNTVLSGNIDDEVTLARERGDLTVTPQAGGAALPGAEVTIEPVDGPGPGSSGRETTDESGRATFGALESGRYRVRVRPGRDAFGTTEETISLGGSDTSSEVGVDVPFEFELDAAHRQRLRELEGRLDDLTVASDRDVAVPHYFASAARQLCTEAERIPCRGDVIARTGLDPSRVASALVDASERTVAVVEDAMNAKRSVDLFSVSADLPAAEVTWDGEFDVDAFVRAATDPDVGRRLTSSRLEEVDERVTKADAELADVAPVRELLDRIRSGYDLSDGDRATVAARALAALGLLDAIEETFEHERLRERLNTTLF
jgi:hypothetical protein